MIDKFAVYQAVGFAVLSGGLAIYDTNLLSYVWIPVGALLFIGAIISECYLGEAD